MIMRARVMIMRTRVMIMRTRVLLGRAVMNPISFVCFNFGLSDGKQLSILRFISNLVALAAGKLII